MGFLLLLAALPAPRMLASGTLAPARGSAPRMDVRAPR